MPFSGPRPSEIRWSIQCRPIPALTPPTKKRCCWIRRWMPSISASIPFTSRWRSRTNLPTGPQRLGPGRRTGTRARHRLPYRISAPVERGARCDGRTAGRIRRRGIQTRRRQRRRSTAAPGRCPSASAIPGPFRFRSRSHSGSRIRQRSGNDQTVPRIPGKARAAAFRPDAHRRHQESVRNLRLTSPHRSFRSKHSSTASVWPWPT